MQEYIETHIGGAGWRLAANSFLGRGASGVVLTVCLNKNCEFVVKVQREDFASHREYHTLTLMDSMGLNDETIMAKFFPEWSTPTYVMGGARVTILVFKKYEPYQGYANNLVWEKLTLLHDQGFTHNDFHLKNVVQSDAGPLLIDFGRTTYWNDRNQPQLLKWGGMPMTHEQAKRLLDEYLFAAAKNDIRTKRRIQREWSALTRDYHQPWNQTEWEIYELEQLIALINYNRSRQHLKTKHFHSK